MTEKKSPPKKPVTLEDYISDEPVISPEAKKAARDSLSSDDRARLEALERAVRDTEPDAVHRSKKNRSRANQRRKAPPKKKGKLVFWIVVALLIVVFANLD